MSSVPDATSKTLHEAAKLAIKEHRYADAARSMERAVAHDARDAWAHDLLGIAYQRMGRPDEALKCFQTAVELKPDSPSFLYNLGAMLGQQGVVDDGIEALQKCLSFDSEHKLAKDLLERLQTT